MERKLLKLLAPFAAILLAQTGLSAATLSDPEVDAYNVRIGTQTFSGLYQFTTDNLLVETANAITNMGCDTIKMYLGANYPGKYHTNLPPTVTSLTTLARNEPNCRHVLDMPFRRIIAWAYPLSNPDAPFQNVNYTATQQANDYREMYDLTRYLLTNYNNSGKTFYLGHWEGDGYLSVNNWSTNPAPYVVSNMIIWENTRQKGVDDAKRDTALTTNVDVFYYAEANRTRDAMLNGPNNNVRMINSVIPYVTNLDYLSYSSYDVQNLSTTTLYATLDYMEAKLPTNKVSVIPGERIWIGEYGWGGSQTPAQQEPTTRAYIQRLLNYRNNALLFILFWEIYDNETNSNGSYKNFYLIDPAGAKVPCWYLHQRFVNSSRLLAAQFKETNGRLPSDAEYVSLISPLLDQSLSPPVNLSVTNAGATLLTNSSATVSGTLTQGVYGDEEAGVWVFYGRQDGGSNSAAWESSRFAGVNTHFNPATFTATLNNLVSNTNYFFRFYAANSSSSAWAASSATFRTATLQPVDFGSRLKISFAGYNRGEVLSNFPVLVSLSTSLPGFSYRQFASPSGGDLRFTDADGLTLLPHEIDEWNTNGVSYAWVRVPSLSGTNDCIWAYWGNPLDATPPAWATNGAVWLPSHQLVWHLKESGFPFADSTQQHPALPGIAPVSATGEIGRGVSFNGTSQFLSAGNLALGTAFTLSAWVKLDPAASNIQTIWANKAGGWNADGFSLFVNSYQTTDRMLRLETGDGVNGVAAVTATGAVSLGQWHLLSAAVDRSAGTARLFIDGADATQGSSATTDFANSGLVDLAQITNGSFRLKGAMDEARVENVARSSNWVWASWMTVAANAALQNYSAVIPQAPVLSLNTTPDNGIILTWPGSGVGLTTFVSTNLIPPVTWSAVTMAPVWTNSQWQIALPHSDDAVRFYRLQSQ